MAKTNKFKKNKTVVLLESIRGMSADKAKKVYQKGYRKYPGNARRGISMLSTKELSDIKGVGNTLARRIKRIYNP